MFCNAARAERAPEGETSDVLTSDAWTTNSCWTRSKLADANATSNSCISTPRAPWFARQLRVGTSHFLLPTFRSSVRRQGAASARIRSYQTFSHRNTLTGSLCDACFFPPRRWSTVVMRAEFSHGRGWDEGLPIGKKTLFPGTEEMDLLGGKQLASRQEADVRPYTSLDVAVGQQL